MTPPRIGRPLVLLTVFSSGLVSLAAAPSRAEPVFFDDTVQKGDWFVWPSAHRKLGVAWKTPWRLADSQSGSDRAESMSVTLVQDEDGLGFGVLIRSPVATTTEEATATLSGQIPNASIVRPRSVDFGGTTYGVLAVELPDELALKNWLLIAVGEGDMTVLSITVSQQRAGSIADCLAEIERACRISRTIPVAEREPRPESAWEPRESDWRAAEEVARRYLVAMLTVDGEAIDASSLAVPNRGVLSSGPAPPEAAKQLIGKTLEKAPFRRLRLNERVDLPDGQVAVMGPNRISRRVVQFMPTIGGQPMPTPLPVVNANGVWKVDPTSLIAARQAAAKAARR